MSRGEDVGRRHLGVLSDLRSHESQDRSIFRYLIDVSCIFGFHQGHHGPEIPDSPVFEFLSPVCVYQIHSFENFFVDRRSMIRPHRLRFVFHSPIPDLTARLFLQQAL